MIIIKNVGSATNTNNISANAEMVSDAISACWMKYTEFDEFMNIRTTENTTNVIADNLNIRVVLLNVVHPTVIPCFCL